MMKEEACPKLSSQRWMTGLGRAGVRWLPEPRGRPARRLTNADGCVYRLGLQMRGMLGHHKVMNADFRVKMTMQRAD